MIYLTYLNYILQMVSAFLENHTKQNQLRPSIITYNQISTMAVREFGDVSLASSIAVSSLVSLWTPRFPLSKLWLPWNILANLHL